MAAHHKDGQGSESPQARPKNPWWIPRIIFGPITQIKPQLVTLLGCVSIALFYENYDLSLLNVSLKHIGETFRIEEVEFGFFIAKIRFWSLLALLVIPFIDLIGRRRLILLSIIGMSVATCLTAFSQTPEQFIRFQVLSRVFILTASATALVIIAEEFPAKKRGWAIGMLAVAAVIGHAFGALFFAAIDWIPYGWRALYFIGIIPVFRMPMFRRGIYETRHFQQHINHRLKYRLSTLVNWFRPYIGLARNFPLRTGGMVLASTMSAGGFSVVYSFIVYYLLTYHNHEPWQYSGMLILCGAVVLPAVALSGRLADRFGRRPVGFSFLTAFPLFTLLFFRGPSSLLYLSLVLVLYSALSGTIIIRAFATELFPTAYRGTSTGLAVIMETIGAGAGLFTIGLLTDAGGDLIRVIPFISAATLVSAFILLLFPETGSKKLEESDREMDYEGQPGVVFSP